MRGLCPIRSSNLKRAAEYRDVCKDEHDATEKARASCSSRFCHRAGNQASHHFWGSQKSVIPRLAHAHRFFTTYFLRLTLVKLFALFSYIADKSLPQSARFDQSILRFNLVRRLTCSLQYTLLQRYNAHNPPIILYPKLNSPTAVLPR